MSRQALKRLATTILLLLYAILLYIYFFSHLNFKKSNDIDQYYSSDRVEFKYRLSGIARIVDGDSLYVGKKEIRLLDIDAPEYNQICFDVNNKEYRCGIISKIYLQKFADGKQIECHYNKKDRYNRYLSYCYKDKAQINAAILAAGMAVIYDFSQLHDQDLKNKENIAREARKGIWQGKFQLPKDYRKLSR